jgi:prophage regulatory protein
LGKRGDADDGGDDGGGDASHDGTDDPDAPSDRIVVGGRCLINYGGLRALGLSYTRVRIWQLMKKGGFPKSVTFGGQRPYWVLSEVEKWIDDRFNARFAEPDQHNNEAA